MTVNEIDTCFTHPGVVCCHEAGGVLVDPGPAISIASVIDALGGEAPRAVVLTHIHLDHAGGTGHLVERFPDLPVYIHETGAPHLADPSRLLASAARVFGPVEPIFGAPLPVPEQNIHTVADGDRVEGFQAIHTPGHSGHHLAYLHEDSGILVAGDVAGEAFAPHETVIIPTPPPEIDVELWVQSIDRVAALRPAALGLAHYGRIDDVEGQLVRTKEALLRGAEIARGTDAAGYVAYLDSELARLPHKVAEQLRAASPPFEQLWAGYERYWRKRAERA